MSTSFLIFSYNTQKQSKWEFIRWTEKASIVESLMRGTYAEYNIYTGCSWKLSSSSILGVPFDHWEQIELYRSSRQAVIPSLYGLLQRRFHLVQNCLWAVRHSLLVQSICELQSLRRRARQVCGILGPF